MIALGIDCGTQGTKTLAVDADDAAVLAQASQAYDVLQGLPPGHMEQDPQTWVDALDTTVSRTLEQLGPRRSEVAAIGVSGQQHGFVALDANDHSIRPAKLWCDTSTADECALFEHHFGGVQGLIELTGNAIPPGFTAPKILWLKRHEPHHFARLATVLLPHDYLNFHLTGVKRMEFGDASGSALLDVRKRQWCSPVVDFIDPDLASKLPPLDSSRLPVGTLRPDLAKRWGLKDDVIVSSGGGDNMMGAIGTGNVRQGRVTASLGTSGTIYAYADAPVVDPQGEIAAFCDSTDGWLPLVCTMNVTVATEAARRLFGWSLDEFNAQVAATPPGAGGLLFLPYLQGERTPNLPRGCGVFHGLNLQNTSPAHLARAAMEGVTLGLAYGLRRMAQLGLHPSEIRLIGGGSKSAVWRQVCADVFNCRIVTTENPEGAALGGAIQGIAAARPERSIAEWADALVKVNPAETCEPSRAFDYQALLDRQTNLMRHLASAAYL